MSFVKHVYMVVPNRKSLCFHLHWILTLSSYFVNAVTADVYSVYMLQWIYYSSGLERIYMRISRFFFLFQRQILIFLLGNDLFPLPGAHCAAVSAPSLCSPPCSASLESLGIVILQVRIISFYFATVPCYFYPAVLLLLLFFFFVLLRPSSKTTCGVVIITRNSQVQGTRGAIRSENPKVPWSKSSKNSISHR